MSGYTEVYVMPVKKDHLEDYRRFAEASGKVWRAHGALSVVEYIADDVKPGKQTSFPQSVKLEPDEIVAVAVIHFASQKECLSIKSAVMKDPLFAESPPDAIPVDGMRMFWGGFTTLVEC